MATVKEEIAEERSNFVSSSLSLENSERQDRLEVKYDFDANRILKDSRPVSQVLMDYIKDYSEVAWW